VIRSVWPAALLLLFMLPGSAPAQVQLDAYSTALITQAVADQKARMADPERRAERITSPFLGTPYEANRLQGSSTTPEQLVIDLERLDCLTFLDYVEALRKTSHASAFQQNLVLTRYAQGIVSYPNRRHFFTDWAATLPRNAVDITPELSLDSRTVTKTLNAGKQGVPLIPGLGVVARDVHFIPASRVGLALISKLRPGDYVGIYSPAPGLDVTHVGVFLNTEQGPVLRNASSRPSQHKVIDSPFLEYVSKTPGIVVLRPIAP